MLNRARLWIRALLRRRRLEREMQAEMASHLERATTRLMARGLSAGDARLAAQREFGNVAVLQEEARDARGAGWLDALAGDLRFAIRHFARKPGTTAVMFTVLAVGMSISALLFVYVHSYAVQPPPGIARQDDLVRIRGSRDAGAGGRGYRGFSGDELRAYRALGDHFAAVTGWTDANAALDAGTDAERRGLGARVSFVTENYFPVLRVRPQLGPGLPARAIDDPTTAAVAVIGHAAWEQLYGKDPGVIGSTLHVNGVPVTIVGVAPQRFIGALGAYAPLQLWVPLSARRLLMPDTTGDFRAVARLRPGVTHATATAATQVIAARIAASDSSLRTLEPSTEVVPFISANSDPMFDRDVRLMSASVGLLGLLVLLVTCTNVSALLTGLAMARRREIAVRLSLGAARARLVRQLLTESALLAVVAGGAALGIVWSLIRLTIQLAPPLPFEVGVTWPATTFTFGVALAVGVLFGLSPGAHATRLTLAGALRDSSATIAGARARLQRGLVVAQIAFTQPLIVLLAAVLVFLFSEFHLQAVPYADRSISVNLRPTTPVSTSAVPADQLESVRQLRVTTRRLLDQVRATPGVEGAVADWQAVGDIGSYAVHPEDRVAGASDESVPLSAGWAAAGYFRLVGIPVLRGREFEATDVSPAWPRPAQASVLVGADLARRLWPGADPVGRRLRATRDSMIGTLVVVGVVDDPAAEFRKPGQEYRIYLPPDTSQTPKAILVRTAGSARVLIPTVRQLVQQEAPNVVATLRTVEEIQDGHRRMFRLVTSGVSAAGLMALLLSAIGLYAVIAFAVGQRTSEIAVRMAFGARGQQIARMFVADGLRLSAFGIAFGLPISVLGLHVLMAAVPDIPPVRLSPVTGIAALGVALVATAAAWIPARRAAAVDPAITLRRE